MSKESNFSWDPVASWYDQVVGEKGHYYHKQVIIPNVLKLMEIHEDKSCKVLDLACGQGIVARHLPKNSFYTGIDFSKKLINAAKSHLLNKNHQFIHHDLTKPLNLPEKEFTHALFILAAQNIEFLLPVFKNAYENLKKGGKFIIVLNHPCFRIPRQSSWAVDLEKKVQYRSIYLYLSKMKIPIITHPGKDKPDLYTWSYHHPLSSYSKWLKESGFCIEVIEEWCSDKKSTGKKADMENRARAEFPLFLTIVAKK